MFPTVRKQVASDPSDPAKDVAWTPRRANCGEAGRAWIVKGRANGTTSGSGKRDHFQSRSASQTDMCQAAGAP
jgi:hypothetical protein